MENKAYNYLLRLDSKYKKLFQEIKFYLDINTVDYIKNLIENDYKNINKKIIQEKINK